MHKQVIGIMATVLLAATVSSCSQPDDQSSASQSADDAAMRAAESDASQSANVQHNQSTVSTAPSNTNESTVVQDVSHPLSPLPITWTRAPQLDWKESSPSIAYAAGDRDMFWLLEDSAWSEATIEICKQNKEFCMPFNSQVFLMRINCAKQSISELGYNMFKGHMAKGGLYSTDEGGGPDTYAYQNATNAAIVGYVCRLPVGGVPVQNLGSAPTPPTGMPDPPPGDGMQPDRWDGTNHWNATHGQPQ